MPASVTYLFLGLLACMILCLAMEEKIHAKKSVIVGVFAILALFLGTWFGLLPFDDVGALVIGGHAISLPVYVPGVDWEVIAIILGSSLFVDVTSKSGLFTWVAVKLTKLSRGDPLRLLILYGVMTVVFSAVLNNADRPGDQASQQRSVPKTHAKLSLNAGGHQQLNRTRVDLGLCADNVTL